MDGRDKNNLDKVLKKASLETPPPFHMQRTLQVAKQEAIRRKAMKKRYFAPLAGTAFIVTLVAALLFIPVTYKIHVGSMVTVEWTPGHVNPSELMGDLQNLDNAINVNFQGSSEFQRMFIAFENMKGSKAIKLVNDYFEKRTDIDDLEISSRDITKEVGGNALAAITGGRIVINAAGMSDDEMEAHLIQELSVAGYNIQNVSVQTDENGMKHMEFSFEADEESAGAEGEETTEIEILY